ncbi:MAG: hypothetical protein AAGA44_12355 [Pseudomonadota bacterium]
MLESAAGSKNDVDHKDDTGHKAVVLRKIWLPKLVYDCLPYFYLVSGIAALFATLYINQWFWVVPHYLLFSAACLHLAIVVFRRRLMNRS